MSGVGQKSPSYTPHIGASGSHGCQRSGSEYIFPSGRMAQVSASNAERTRENRITSKQVLTQKVDSNQSQRRPTQFNTSPHPTNHTPKHNCLFRRYHAYHWMVITTQNILYIYFINEYGLTIFKIQRN